MEDRKLMRYFGYIIVVVLVFVGGFTFGRIIPETDINLFNSISAQPSKEVNMDLFWKVWNTMNDQYVEEGKVSSQDMYYGAIKGIVDSYGDPATVFLDPKETKEFNDTTAGIAFSGIGAELGYDKGQIVVVAPIDGSPAFKAGVRPGDIILKVDGKEIGSDENIYAVVRRIRGEVGTQVELELLRKSGKVETVKITRGNIDIPSIEIKSVKGRDDIKIIDVGRFTEESVSKWNSEWDNAVTEVLKSKPKGVIIDLRSNPGGYLDSAIHSASEFVPKGTVLAKHKDREGREQQYKSVRDGRMQNIPVIILVDGASASASEIMAGGLQVLNRAKVIGETTYGKGTAQSIVELPDGSSLHITTLKWLLPNGEWINRENRIKPDIEVKFSEDMFKQGRDNQLEKAIEMFK